MLSIIRWIFDLSLEKMYNASGLSLRKQNMYVAAITFQVGLISRFTLHNRSDAAGLQLETFAGALVTTATSIATEIDKLFSFNEMNFA